MKLMKIALSASFLFSAAAVTGGAPTAALAHEHKLDSMGCHYARGHRNFHCHEGRLKGRTFKSRAEAIRNYNRIQKDKDDDDDDDGVFF